jgi:hypothetical protein
MMFDTVTLDDDAKSSMRTTSNGYLVASPRVARTGIQLYGGHELGFTDERRHKVFKVFRPENEVFKNDSLHSFAHKPVTDDHPPRHVDAASWSKHARGFMGGEVARDGQFVRVPMLLTDQNLINKVKSGKAELSVGYACDIVWDSGTTPDGEQYDAQQRNIHVNHVAVVDAGRGGPQLRIGDVEMKTETLHRPGSLPMTDADRASREKLYEQRDKRLTDAWKNPPSLDASQAKIAITPAASTDIYERRDARLRDAWRAA